MDEDDFSINTSCVVSAYINGRLQKAGYAFQTSPTRNCANNKVITTTRKLCEEFEKRYERQFKDMCAANGEVDIQRESYMNVLDHLIEDGLNWGRVVAIFTFSGAMSVYCMQKEQKENVDLIREWTCLFMSSKVESWINNNDGWKGLVDFYDNGQAKPEEKKSGWGTLILGGACVALGAFIVNRA